MTDKQHNTTALVILLFVPLIFIFGIVAWQNKRLDMIIEGRKLYYLSMASVMYMGFFVVFLLAQSKLLKAVSSTVVSLFAVNLYEEIVIGAKAWTSWNWWLVVIVAANYYVLYRVIDKYKSKLNDRRNSSSD